MANTSWSGERSSFPRETRKLILARQPVCCTCGQRPSTIADHEPNYMTLIRMGVANPNDQQYGQGMCGECHDVKTKAETIAGRNRGKRAARMHPSD